MARYLSKDLGVGLPPDEVAAQVIAIPHPKYQPDPDALAAASPVLPFLADLTTDAVAALG